MNANSNGHSRDQTFRSGTAVLRRPIFTLLLFAFLLHVIVPGAQADLDPEYVDRSVIEQAWKIVRDKLYDPGMCGVDWNKVLQKYREQGSKATTQREVRNIINSMLGELKLSHLALIERDIYEEHVIAEFENRKIPTFGLELTESDFGIFVANVLEGSIAKKKGIRRGDRLIAIDEQTPLNSKILRPSAGDPGLDSARGFYLSANKPAVFEFERIPDIGPKGIYKLTLHPEKWNSVAASIASIEVKKMHGLSLGYMHMWHLASMDVVEGFEKALLTKFYDCDGLVLDLRGRGGTPENVDRVMSSFESFKPYGIRWTKPVVAIIDSGTRSAKEVLAFHLKRKNIATIVGERTQGAVLGGKFHPLKDGSFLIVPAVDMRALTMGVSLEGNGVKPHIRVEDKLEFANGKDVIRERAVNELFWQLRHRLRKGRRHGYY